jgi:O-antigen/teichoic acid export membrane protein
VSSDIASRARSGTKVLALRNAVTQVLRIASSVVVARWLSPEDFGLFAVLIYISGLPLYIQNLGLGGALIQQREEPSQEQWSSAFFAQLGMAVLLFGLIVTFGPALLRIFEVPAEAYWLLVVAALPSLIAALGFYQTAFLQRHLEFRKFATAAFLNDIASVIALVMFALSGFGIWTLVLAPVLAGCVNMFVLFWLSPWRPDACFRLTSLRPLFRAGVPMQINTTLPAALDGWMPFYTHRLLGSDPLGFLNLAQRLAAMPASYLQILNQVALPSFSRLQADPDELLMRLKAVLHRMVVLCLCGYATLAVWIPDIVGLVYGDRWRPAGYLLQYLGISVVLVAMAGVIGPALNALGRHWMRTLPMLVGYGAVWIVGYLLIVKHGSSGLGLAIVCFGAIQIVGLALLLPRVKLLWGRIFALTGGTAFAGLAVSTAMLLLSGELSNGTKVLVSAAGLAALLLINLAEIRRGHTSTLKWALELLRPSRPKT